MGVPKHELKVPRQINTMGPEVIELERLGTLQTLSLVREADPFRRRWDHRTRFCARLARTGIRRDGLTAW